MMKFNMTYLLILILLFLSGCQSASSAAGKSQPAPSAAAKNKDWEKWRLPYDNWEFVFYVPAELKSSVEFFSFIDVSRHIYRLRRVDSTIYDPYSVGKWNEKTMKYRNLEFNKISSNLPPIFMLFCWDSNADEKTYETHVIFSPDLWQKMKTPAERINRSGKPFRYDYNRIVIGLAPGGKVRFWLMDTDGYPNIPVSVGETHTLSGDKLGLCKPIQERHDKSKAEGDDDFEGDRERIAEFIKGKTYPYGSW